MLNREYSSTAYNVMTWDRVNGNVGIGTTSPETKLEVTGTASGQYVFGQKGLGASGALVIKPRPGSGTGNTLIVDTSGLVYDATNKRVGIGTAAPDTRLEVVNSDSTSDLSITGNDLRISDSIPGIEFIDSDAADRTIYSNSGLLYFVRSPWIADMVLDANGNLGIGTTAPETKLDVIGSMSGRTLQITGTGAAPLIKTVGGNVGIGTATPGYILDVQDAASKVNSRWGYLTNGADYAEYFENEEVVASGSLVGMNLQTGMVRRYRPGDEFIGIASDGKGFVGNGNAQVERNPHYTLVGLLGQLKFRPELVDVKGRIVYTRDGMRIGLLLTNGKVLLR
jgi:hypothetical protein